jgi:hypothetical protein
MTNFNKLSKFVLNSFLIFNCCEYCTDCKKHPKTSKQMFNIFHGFQVQFLPLWLFTLFARKYERKNFSPISAFISLLTITEKLIRTFHACGIFSKICQFFKWWDLDSHRLARSFFKWKFVCFGTFGLRKAQYTSQHNKFVFLKKFFGTSA